eukprot:CAMPEP_0173115224 /NCGR_PEP_ID=MMETSP1102-20130122/48257_1 /TAXON_ID=49646 /ORGANISM="Geminigera sp., Strain Caron Lab Isolate" /LENGTH=365 /DNA_ID=CAMNT_0014017987 /DNA_START=26 /DNA_END=1120 /DNA_ORIENTATION=+
MSHSVKLRQGYTACEASGWQSETSITSQTLSGSRGTRQAIVTIGERTCSLSQGWSSDLGGLRVGRRGNQAGTGAISMTVHGSSMGLVAHTVRALQGATRCKSTEWKSETTVRCLVGSVVKGTRRVLMTAGDQINSLTLACSTDRFELSSMHEGSHNRELVGSTSVTVLGSGLGHVAFTGRIRQEHTDCEATVWDSSTSIRCLSGHGMQGTKRVVVTVGERGGSSSQIWSLDGTGLSSVRRNNLATTVPESVTVQGTSLGEFKYTARARQGNTGCPSTDWVSETSVQCHTGPGQQKSRRMVITSGQCGGSITQALSFDGNCVGLVRRANLAATGSASITVHGTSMASVSFTSRSQVGQTSCEASDW